MDPIQLLGSFISIALLAGVAALFFPTKPKLGRDSALADYRRFNPTAVIGEPLFSTDGHTALVPVTRPKLQLGLVTQLGDRWVCRTLTPADRPQLTVKDGKLIITHHDFTQPTVKLTLSSKDLEAATALLAPLTSSDGGLHAA